MPNVSGWTLGHRPALDGVRAVAVALVLLTHTGVPYSHEMGAAGVTAALGTSVETGPRLTTPLWPGGRLRAVTDVES